VRYMEDFVIMVCHHDKQYLPLRLEIEGLLADQLHLKPTARHRYFSVGTHHGRGLGFHRVLAGYGQLTAPAQRFFARYQAQPKSACSVNTPPAKYFEPGTALGPCKCMELADAHASALLMRGGLGLQVANWGRFGFVSG